MAKNRGGRPSNRDRERIAELCTRYTARDISLMIDKPLDYVEGILFRAGLVAVREDRVKDELVEDFTQTPAYRQIAKGLAPDELQYFEYEYGQYSKQFKADITHTERHQIFNAIVYNIMMQRNTVEQRRDQGLISEYQLRIDKIKKSYSMDMPQDVAIQYDELEANLKNVQELKQQKVAEYLRIEDKFLKALGDLKATRDKRETNDGTQRDFMAVLRELSQREKRQEVDIQHAIAMAALEKERARLTAPHVFADGAVGLPLQGGPWASGGAP